MEDSYEVMAMIEEMLQDESYRVTLRGDSYHIKEYKQSMIDEHKAIIEKIVELNDMLCKHEQGLEVPFNCPPDIIQRQLGALRIYSETLNKRMEYENVKP